MILIGHLKLLINIYSYLLILLLSLISPLLFLNSLLSYYNKIIPFK